MIVTGFGNMTARQDQQKLMAEFEEFKERLRRSREVNQEESGGFSKAARAFADRFDAPSIDQREEAAHSPQPRVDVLDSIELTNTNPSDRSMIYNFNLIDVDVRRSYHDAIETGEANHPDVIVDADLTAIRLSHEEEFDAAFRQESEVAALAPRIGGGDPWIGGTCFGDRLLGKPDRFDRPGILSVGSDCHR